MSQELFACDTCLATHRSLEEGNTKSRANQQGTSVQLGPGSSDSQRTGAGRTALSESNYN